MSEGTLGASLLLMTVTGPRDPLSPVGPVIWVSQYEGGGGVLCQQYEDGWMYQASWIPGTHSPILTRAKVVDIFNKGVSISPFVDGEVHYQSFWFDSETHDELFPDGPPPLVEYKIDGGETLRAESARWIDPNMSSPGDSTTQRILKAARRLAMEGQTEESDDE